ncbi:signal recognition particle-docking protein FtsY [Proteiniclasticum sp. SCR006]|uniref:Signal recognition particle receptor FtsY n=1 Tax=Proteiniclasticum aestuarii TaxID=2817862 RepID=A0A939KFW4_9CLOT|nr:signal recognition particle-docking protein FtsY [Proteiniclasticum aestuarii]MBO1263699.1 signal recognition particle-docking protein FtsY [Proteiniclasticum aestuarii]
MANFFEKLKSGLSKTRDNITGKMNEVLGLAMTIDEDLFEELEEVLITSDVGYETSMILIEKLRQKIRLQKITEVDKVSGALKEVISEFMEDEEKKFKVEKPTIILVIGVNGVGKTTSIGKLSHKYKKEGKKVIMAAADTFRAAAIDQLEVWAKRAEVDIVRHQEGSDPAAVVFDALQAFKARNGDVLLVDTAGRLHNKKNLMNELEKIRRVIDREYGDANIYSLLVLDGTSGQNAVIQAKEFQKVAQLDGIVLTKLDGTAKGGVVLSIKESLKIPVVYIGVGEGIDDLQDFDAKAFAEALI